MENPKKLRTKHYLSFGLGDLAFNLFFQGVLSFLLIFYTDGLGIAAGTAGSIFLLASIWDAISDPIMGYIAGRTRTKWGRYRPFILFSAFPLAITYVLLFVKVPFTGTGLLIWAGGLLILFRTFFTLGNIPYSALSSEMTYDTEERGTLAAYRMFLGYAGALIVSYLTGTLMRVLGLDTSGNDYFLVAIVSGILAIVLFFLCFSNTFELPARDHKKGESLSSALGMLTRNRPFLQLCAYIVLGMTGVVIFYQALSYYFTYYLKIPAALGTGMLILFTVLMLSLPFWLKLSQIKGKREALLWGCLVAIIGSISFFLNPMAKTQLLWVYFHMGIIGSGIGCAAFSFWAMLPDTVEYGEWKTGIRAEAVLFGVGLFGLKLGVGLGSFILGYLLEGISYQANASQSATTLDGLHMITTLAMSLPMIAIAIIMFGYPLKSSLHKKILSDLNSIKLTKE